MVLRELHRSHPSYFPAWKMERTKPFPGSWPHYASGLSFYFLCVYRLPLIFLCTPFPSFHVCHPPIKNRRHLSWVGNWPFLYNQVYMSDSLNLDMKFSRFTFWAHFYSFLTRQNWAAKGCLACKTHVLTPIRKALSFQFLSNLKRFPVCFFIYWILCTYPTILT